MSSILRSLAYDMAALSGSCDLGDTYRMDLTISCLLPLFTVTKQILCTSVGDFREESIIVMSWFWIFLITYTQQV